MPTFVLIHGSWHNGKAWQKVKQALSARRVSSYAPTLTGFESMDNPASPLVGLYTHIEDIVRLIQDAGMSDAILVGHSYGGLINVGVAEIIPDRISKLIFLDAFIPEDNQSLFDIMGTAQVTSMRAALVDAAGRTVADGASEAWLLPPGRPQDYGVDDPDDIAWLQREMPFTPVRTFEERVSLSNPAASAIPRFFIRCTEFEYLAPQEQKAINAGWKTYRLQTGHDAMITMPEALVDILLEIAAK